MGRAQRASDFASDVDYFDRSTADDDLDEALTRLDAPLWSRRNRPAFLRLGVVLAITVTLWAVVVIIGPVLDQTAVWVIGVSSANVATTISWSVLSWTTTEFRNTAYNRAIYRAIAIRRGRRVAP